MIALNRIKITKSRKNNTALYTEYTEKFIRVSLHGKMVSGLG